MNRSFKQCEAPSLKSDTEENTEESSTKRLGNKALPRGGIGVRSASRRRAAVDWGHPRQTERCERRAGGLNMCSTETELAWAQGQEERL